jgi:hypothetical protein
LGGRCVGSAKSITIPNTLNPLIIKLGILKHKPVLGLKILKQIYFSYVHSVLNYGIMFWGNSPQTRYIFITQKWIVRIIKKATEKDSCKEMFSKLGILTLYFQYIFFNSYVCCKA